MIIIGWLGVVASMWACVRACMCVWLGVHVYVHILSFFLLHWQIHLSIVVCSAVLFSPDLILILLNPSVFVLLLYSISPLSFFSTLFLPSAVSSTKHPTHMSWSDPVGMLLTTRAHPSLTVRWTKGEHRVTCIAGLLALPPKPAPHQPIISSHATLGALIFLLPLFLILQGWDHFTPSAFFLFLLTAGWFGPAKYFTEGEKRVKNRVTVSRRALCIYCKIKNPFDCQFLYSFRGIICVRTDGN